MPHGRPDRRRTKLIPLKVSKVIKAFEELGYCQAADNGGSHIIMRKEGKVNNLSIPVHGKELPVGVLRSLIRKAGLTVEEFFEHY
ncbi:MAG: type II toxin-antitoxin system HicA family toxin [bacterium]|nr:type II toxin-antitoxin system HicA family toxin [bacterium]